jgi:recombination protein RecR
MFHVKHFCLCWRSHPDITKKMSHSLPLQHLTRLIGRLPGFGPRSARRVVIHLLKHKIDLMENLAQALAEVAKTIQSCSLCGNWDTSSPCHLCTDPRRDPSLICVVEDVADLWALERASSYRGHFHALGGTLSAIHGIGPEQLRLRQLLDRIKAGNITEIILALNATVDGQTTAHYIADRLRGVPVKITALAHGVPVGGELDYLDDGTITTALQARRTLP